MPQASMETWLRDLARLPVIALEDEGEYLEPGTIIAHEYEIRGRLGEGGMGVVYAAWDRALEREVAIKVGRPLGSASCTREVVSREAKRTARVQHPHVVTIHRAGVHEDRVFLVLERLHGSTLDEHVRERMLMERDVLDVMTTIVDAVAHVHREGLVHCDLKPANVFVTEQGTLKVLDLGVAVLTSLEDGALGCTPAYAAPEQIERGVRDPRVDVYALGVMLHELVTGQLPSAAGSDRARRTGALGNDLLGVARRCMARDPNDRCANGSEVAAALLSVQRRHRPMRRALRHVARLLALLAIVTTAALAAWSFWWSFMRTRPSPKTLDRIEGWYVSSIPRYGYLRLVRTGPRRFRWRGYSSPVMTASRPDAFVHEGIVRAKDDGEWVLEGELFDVPGYCCLNQAELRARIADDARIVVERAAWHAPGSPEVAELEAHTFTKIERAFDVGPYR